MAGLVLGTAREEKQSKKIYGEKTGEEGRGRNRRVEGARKKK